LTLLLGDPVLDPSGRDIPKATTEISDRISSKINEFTSLSLLETGQEASIVGLLASEDLIGLFGERLAIGSVIKSLGSSQFDANGTLVELGSTISDSIIVRTQ
jgi:hypothetical protein